MFGVVFFFYMGVMYYAVGCVPTILPDSPTSGEDNKCGSCEKGTFAKKRIVTYIKTYLPFPQKWADI